MKATRRYAGFRLLALMLWASTTAACDAGKAPPAAEPVAAASASATHPASAFIEVAAAGAELPSGSGPIPARAAFRPEALVAVDTPVNARVVSIEVHPGRRVRAGDVLAMLQSAEAASMRAALQNAQARAEAAGDLLRRQDEMADRGIGREVERFDARIRVREARAELDSARRAASMLGEGGGDRIVLRAPVAAVVASVRASVGAMVEAGGEPLIELADPSGLWIVADLAESEVGGIAAGRGATVRIPDLDLRVDGVVESVGSRVDAETRRLPIYVRLTGAAPRLASGMLAEVRLSGEGEPLLSVPTAAVLIKDGARRIVYVRAEDGSFEPRAVRTGRSSDGRVAILEGLQAGESIVVRGALLLDGEAEQLL